VKVACEPLPIVPVAFVSTSATAYELPALSPNVAVATVLPEASYVAVAVDASSAPKNLLLMGRPMIVFSL
jgi:hypothetical protein